MTTITITTTKAKHPKNLADEHFHLKACIAGMKAKLKAVEREIEKTGLNVIEGNFARVTCSEIKVFAAIDYKAAAEECLTPALLAGYVKYSKAHFRVVSKSRRGDDKVA